MLPKARVAYEQRVGDRRDRDQQRQQPDRHQWPRRRGPWPSSARAGCRTRGAARLSSTEPTPPAPARHAGSRASSRPCRASWPVTRKYIEPGRASRAGPPSRRSGTARSRRTRHRPCTRPAAWMTTRTSTRLSTAETPAPTRASSPSRASRSTRSPEAVVDLDCSRGATPAGGPATPPAARRRDGSDRPAAPRGSASIGERGRALCCSNTAPSNCGQPEELQDLGVRRCRPLEELAGCRRRAAVAPEERGQRAPAARRTGRGSGRRGAAGGSCRTSGRRASAPPRRRSAPARARARARTVSVS